MTYAEAAALHESGTNVRWIAFHAAHGHAPRTGSGDFVIWNGARWREFLELNGVKNPRNDSYPIVYAMAKGISTDAAQDAYDAWLKAKFSGKGDQL